MMKKYHFMHHLESDYSVASKNTKKKNASKKKDGKSKEKKKLHRVTIYLTDDQIEYLDDVANKIKVKRSTYIRMLIDADMKGPVMSPGHQHIRWRSSSAATPYVPPRQRKSSGSRPMNSGKMKVHAELMNELKNVLKKRRVDGDEESVSGKTETVDATDNAEEEDKKEEKWKKKAKWATPPPPPPPS